MHQPRLIWIITFVVSMSVPLSGSEPKGHPGLAGVASSFERIGRGVELLGCFKGVPVRPIVGDRRPALIEAVAFVAGDDNIAGVTRGGDVCVWDRGTSQLTRSFSHFGLLEARGSQHGIVNACFSQDGRQVCMDDCFSHLAVWDVGLGKAIAKHDEIGRMRAIAISPDTKQIAIAGYVSTEEGKEEGVVVLWRPQSNSVETIRPKGAARVIAVAYHPGGSLLAVSSDLMRYDGAQANVVRNSIWDVKEMKLNRDLPYKVPVDGAVQFDRRGRYLVGAAEAGEACDAGTGLVLSCWDVMNNRSHRDADWGIPFAISPTSLRMLASRQDGELVCIDFGGAPDRFVVEFKEEEPTATRFSHDGETFLVGTTHGNVYLLRILDISARRETQQ